MITFFVGTDDSRPDQLNGFLEHLKEQTSQDYEVVICDEGNNYWLDPLGWKVYRRESAEDWHYTAKNEAVASGIAEGDFYCFPQDDARYRPDFVELMQPPGSKLNLCSWVWHDQPCEPTMPPAPALGQVDVGGFTVHRDAWVGFDVLKYRELCDGQAVQHVAQRWGWTPINEVLYDKF